MANATPPAAGEIASGGHMADERAQLNNAGTHWCKDSVRSGQTLAVPWLFDAARDAVLELLDHATGLEP